MALKEIDTGLHHNRFGKFRVKLGKSSVNGLIYFTGGNHSGYLADIFKRL